MLIEQLKKIKLRAQELEAKLADPELFKDRTQYQACTKELARLKPFTTALSEHERVHHELQEIETFFNSKNKDEELTKLYQEEREKLSAKAGELEALLEEKLLEGSNINLDKNIIVEIRAGTGGEEASLFARDLFRMYSRYAANHGLKVEVMNTSLTGKGGIKEIIFGVSGEDVYG